MVPRPVSPYAREPQIPQFYAGKCIFITGATGFMGKVLIERLLWTCPDIGKLYLLMRQKREVSPEKRLSQLKQSQVFDNIREKCPSQLDKLYIIHGDTTEPNLGISLDSMSLLNEVSIVFHGAATLKFDEVLGKSVDQNVRSVMRLLDICDRLPNIQAFIHVSTAYCNADLITVEEKVYTSPVSLDQVLALTDSVPDELMAEITDKFIAPKPNTYTFTKALAENAVEQHRNRGYPVAIFRPTIVISALQHPFPGWIENLNGPSGVVVGAGKGLLHVFCCKNSAKADLLPVDIAIDTLIAVAWETALDKLSEVRVYNCSTIDNPVTWREFETTIRRELRIHPFDKAFWYPSGTVIESKYLQKAIALLTQTLPLHLAEYTVRLFGIKTRLSFITVNQRLCAMSDVLQFFSLREWIFKKDNVRRLQARLSPRDAEIYNLDPQTINWTEHFINFVKGTRKYLLKEKDQDIGEAKRHIRRMYYVHHGFILFLLVLVFRYAMQNPIIRSIVYGTLKLLFSAFNAAYGRIKL
ncbi:putative fatty acyl-CoA reductase CG5065 [Manduca sexta]|nr:putative fatty acyl-CoA reductase CG5065 [Manduca sexta]